VFQIAKDFNGPPGLVHPLLVENFDWVDERLHEMYNGSTEYFPLCPLPLWLRPRDSKQEVSLEDDETSVESYICHKRKCSEPDISNYKAKDGEVIKRLGCQSPIPTGKYHPLLTNPFCNLDCERYNELASNVAYKKDSVSSIDLESELGINASYDKIYAVTKDDSSVFFDTNYDCDGYESP